MTLTNTESLSESDLLRIIELAGSQARLCANGDTVEQRVSAPMWERVKRDAIRAWVERS